MSGTAKQRQRHFGSLKIKMQEVNVEIWLSLLNQGTSNTTWVWIWHWKSDRSPGCPVLSCTTDTASVAEGLGLGELRSSIKPGASSCCSSLQLCCSQGPFPKWTYQHPTAFLHSSEEKKNKNNSANSQLRWICTSSPPAECCKADQVQ